MDCKERPLGTLSSAGILGVSVALVGDLAFSGMGPYGACHHRYIQHLHQNRGFLVHRSCLEILGPAVAYPFFLEKLVHDHHAHSNLEMVVFLQGEVKYD